MRDWSKYKIIKDIYGDEYYLTDSRYSKEYDFTVLFGNSVTGRRGNARAIITRELKKLILGTLDKPRTFLEPVLTKHYITRLRRELRANPYSTYRQWIKHGCKPEFVTFPDARENPQTIFDYAGVEYVLYSARKTSGNVIIYTGKAAVPDKKSGLGLVITPELTQVIFNPDMTSAQKTKKLGIKWTTYNRIANIRFGKTEHKMRFNYMVKNAHQFLSGSAKELYAEFKNDAWCNKNTIEQFQSKAAFIRNRMPGQKYEDPKFIQLLADAAENPCEENRKKYLEYKSRINKGKNIDNLIDAYNILKQSGIWHKYEQLIEHDADQVQLKYITSEREYIKDIRGKTYHVTDIKKDRIFGRIFFGKTRGVLNKRAAVIVTEELAAKIKQLLGKSLNYFSSSILTDRQLRKAREFVLSGLLYSTLDDWIKDKNRPAMVVFNNKDNPQYVTDYFGARWIVRRAEDIRGYFLLKGYESSKTNKKRIGLKPILTSQLVEVVVKYKYDPAKAKQILPIGNTMFTRCRRALGFNMRSDMVDAYAKNYRLITEENIEKIQEKLTFVRKFTVYNVRLRTRQIKEMRASSKARDRKILDKLEQYYKHGENKTRIELNREWGANKSEKIRFAYAVLKKAKEI